MPEWSNGAVSKTVERFCVPRVRIPFSPLKMIMLSEMMAFFVNPAYFTIKWSFCHHLCHFVHNNPPAHNLILFLSNAEAKAEAVK